MKWLNCVKIRLFVVGFLVAIVFDGVSVKADFTFDALPVQDMPGSGYDVSFSSDGLRLYITPDPSSLAGGYGSYDIWVVERESPSSPWGPPVNLGPNINTSGWEDSPTISPDDLELYFGRGDETTGYPMRSTRASKDDPWGPATSYTGVYPFDFSSDGLTKYTYDNWSGGYGGNDIWMVTRATKEDDWGEPVNLGPNVNTEYNEYFPSISSDGRVLFFVRTGKNYRLFMCMRATTEDPWGPSVDLGATVNSGGWVVRPEISPDGSTLYCNRMIGFTQVSIKPVVDFNGDNIYDNNDLIIMMGNWHTSESLFDIGPMPWGDGVVDFEDLKVFIKYWEQDNMPKAHWKLNETGGNIAYDSEGENDGTLFGEPLWQPEGGMIDGAIELDGIDDYIKTPFILNPASGHFSVFAWVKGGLPNQTIISQDAGSNWLSTDPNGCLMTELKGGRGACDLLSEVVITDGDWHRIGLVYDVENRTLYVDDVIAATDTQYGLESSEGGLYIGAGKGLEQGTFFSGMIDDIRIYNRVIIP